ncbi:hypothetical protein OHA_1_01433 [Pleomorphomonas sp. SM30]|nr:hypothetical protein OHA_1_01433 [Pleomorphomonas sp. SM30]
MRCSECGRNAEEGPDRTQFVRGLVAARGRAAAGNDPDHIGARPFHRGVS